MCQNTKCPKCKSPLQIFSSTTLNYLLTAFRLSGIDRQLPVVCPRCDARLTLSEVFVDHPNEILRRLSDSDAAQLQSVGAEETDPGHLGSACGSHSVHSSESISLSAPSP